VATGAGGSGGQIPAAWIPVNLTTTITTIRPSMVTVIRAARTTVVSMGEVLSAADIIDSEWHPK
jgi:hypothetical protein